jgi:hypothetical protein
MAKAKRGRPRKAKAPDDADSTATNEAMKQLDTIIDRVEKQLGFRPNRIQALQYIFKRSDV